jgi:hypothetical protein
MMTKDQLDIVQRSCNTLLMEVYADRVPRLKKEKEQVEKTWTAAIIQMEQYLARRQHFQQRSLVLRQQIQKRYSGHHHDIDSSIAPVGPPASSPHTPSMGHPARGILKNPTGKSTSRWEEDRPTNHTQRVGLSPPTRRHTSGSSCSSDDDDDDDDDDIVTESQGPPLLDPSGTSTLPTFSLQPTRV